MVIREIAKPLEIFRSQKSFDDWSADDMRSGDLSEQTLKQRFGLIAVSDRVDCYSFKKLNHHYGSMPTLSREQTGAILFDQFRFEIGKFAWGQYRDIIKRMIDHMQFKNGQSWHDPQLDLAYKNLIINNKSQASALELIRLTLTNFADWHNGLNKSSFSKAFTKMHLPKFLRFEDNYNGLGISVHDINSTRIMLDRLDFNGDTWIADITFIGQDHFGLDKTDIQKAKFKYLPAFRIWFVLQRYQKLAWKPFLVNIKAKVTITGKNQFR
ncbi:DUF3289 family protein [Kalamiella sp. sgz302252]|uniref:DUF3289 family protein n=1 Tax=Pantoea sp. sgz302252 TaxID=3341827 RepID=UPI0036D230AC